MDGTPVLVCMCMYRKGVMAELFHLFQGKFRDSFPWLLAPEGRVCRRGDRDAMSRVGSG
jgi:hypothetical protein